MDIWAISIFWILKIALQWIFANKFLFEYFFSILLAIFLAGNYWITCNSMVNLFLQGWTIIYSHHMLHFKTEKLALAGVAQWVECSNSKDCQFKSQSRAHVWVAGQVPSRGSTRGNYTLMFLSLSFSLPSPFSKNK